MSSTSKKNTVAWNSTSNKSSDKSNKSSDKSNIQYDWGFNDKSNVQFKPRRDKILSIKKILKNNNFIFKCNVIEECCSYETTLNFLDTIKNKSFCEEAKFNDEKDVDDNDDDDVSPVHLVKLIGKIIQNIIKKNSYNIEKEYDIKNGIKIIFVHEFLGCTYILNLKRDYFTKKYVNLETTDLSSLVLHLLNENEELKKKIANQFCYEEISRIKFIQSGLWTKSPFDISYNTQDIVDSKDNIRKWVFKKYKHPESNDKSDSVGMLKHAGIIQQKNVKSMIFADNASVVSISSNQKQNGFMNSSEGIVLQYSKANHLSNILRLVKEQNDIYLTGKLYIKMDVTGALLKKHNLSYNNNRTTARFVTLDSLNKFLFNKKCYVIGKVIDLKRNMESKYFIVSYTMQRLFNNSTGTHYIKVVYQIKLNGGALTIHFIKAYQNSNNMECKLCNNSYSGTINQQPSLGAADHASVAFNANCTYPSLQLHLKLYNN